MLSKIKAIFIVVIASGINEVVKLTNIKTQSVTFLLRLEEVFNLFLSFCPTIVLINWDQISAFVLKLFLLFNWQKTDFTHLFK